MTTDPTGPTGNDARSRLQEVDASFTSVAGRGLIRGRSKHCFIGARVLAVDVLDGVEAEAQVASIHGEIIYLRVDWATHRPTDPGRTDQP